ncbi:MAG: hypothetical protein KGO51_02075 [Alphaproteobacteria bacterium]|nr:hypothetical protein [Alphaproteobacteria bacterium]
MPNQVRLLCGAACALIAASAAHAAAPAGPPVAKITVASLKAQLGESLGTWRAAPPPPGMAGYQPVCRPEQWRAGSPLEPSTPQAAQACTYEKTFGSLAIQPSVRLEPGDYRVRRVTWYFQDGRLTAVTAHANSNAYDSVARALAEDYGKPADTLRRKASTRDGPLPQVVMAWRGKSSQATITDPAPPRWDLRLLFSESALAAPGAAQAQASAPSQG